MKNLEIFAWCLWIAKRNPGSRPSTWKSRENPGSRPSTFDDCEFHLRVSMDFFCQKKKLDLFIMCTTHFRTFQTAKVLIFQDKSVGCCYTLLKIYKFKSFYIRNPKRQLNNFNRPEFLMNWLFPVQKLSNCNCK